MNTVAIVLENDWYGMEWGETTVVHDVFVDDRAAFEFIFSKLVAVAGDEEAKKARVAFKAGVREFKYYRFGNYVIVTKPIRS